MKGGGRARVNLENGCRELERASFDSLGGRLELHQQRGDVDASMRRGVRP